MALSLAKDGWWGGDPGKVLAAPVDEVLEAVAYDRFRVQYQNEMIRLSKGDSE